MKHLIAICVMITFITTAWAQAPRADYRVVPLPNSINGIKSTDFTLTDQCLINYPRGNRDMERNAMMLSQYIEELTGMHLSTRPSINAKDNATNITLMLDPKVEGDEGYSGMDGRTTIFDYWSVPTLRRWHQGKSTASEKKLRSLYRKVLRLCNSEPTLARGQFFDLMYVNHDTLNPARQYAYLRHCDGEMTLVVANFDDQPVDTAVRIPQHALECAQMPHGACLCRHLLSDDGLIAMLRREGYTIEPIVKRE